MPKHNATVEPENTRSDPPGPEGISPPFALPPDLPTFTGRDDLMETLDRVLQPGERAAVSVVGPVAGVGKSALALHAAHRWRDRFPGGVVWVDLEIESRACDALRYVARLYGCRERAAQASDDVQALAGLVGAILRDRRCLLILDGADEFPADELEHLLPGVPGLVTVVTSRGTSPALERLGEPLRVGAMDGTEAETLLARLVGDGEQHGAWREPAQRLGYLPLALDLAGRCARAEGWGPAEALRRLERAAGRVAALGLPATGGPEDTATLALALSYDVLDGPDQELFRALGCFAPTGFTPPAVDAVLGREDAPAVTAALERLAALQLVRQGATAGRYGLHPLLRDCARALAERAGERERWAGQHAGHFTVRIDRARRQLAGPATAMEAVTMATVERGNLLAALETSLVQALWNNAVSLAYQLDDLFKHSGHWAARRRALEVGIEAARQGGRRRDEAGLAHNLGLLAQGQGDYAEARRLYEEALGIAERLDDRTSVAVTLHNLGMLAQKQEDYAGARRLHQRAARAFEQLGDQAGVARTLHQLGNVAYRRGDYLEARRQFRASLDIAEQLGDRAAVAATTSQMGMVSYLQGNVRQAQRLYGKSLSIRREMGDDQGVATILHQLAVLAEDQGDALEAGRLYGEYLDMARQLGDREAIAQTLHRLGRLAEEGGDLKAAERFFIEGLATFEALGSPEVAVTRRSLERVRGRREGKEGKEGREGRGGGRR